MDLVAFSSVVATLGGVAITSYVKVLKPKLREAKEKKKVLFEMIENIHKEVNFNGGSTIKDAIRGLQGVTEKINFRLGQIEENQRVAMNLQGLAFWSSDADGLCTYASPGLCKILGRSEDELLGNGWAGWLVSEDKQRVFSAWQFSVENRSPFDEIYTYKKTDGTVIKVWGLAFHKSVDGVHSGTLGKLVIID